MQNCKIVLGLNATKKKLNSGEIVIMPVLSLCQSCTRRVIFPKKSHFAKIFKNARYVFSNCVKTVHIKKNSFTGLSSDSLANIWYQNELLKSFGSRDRILPIYGHGRGRFGIFRQSHNLPSHYPDLPLTIDNNKCIGG